jgi:UDP-N-acetyl-D-mannosaminuronate dehydrogenase
MSAGHKAHEIRGRPPQMPALNAGALQASHQPECADAFIIGLGVPLLSFSECLTGADGVMILTDYPQFRNIANSMLRLMRHPIMVDTRNALADRMQHGNHLTLLTLGAMHSWQV